MAKRKMAKVLSSTRYQSGKRKSIVSDRNKKAMPPGKRRASVGMGRRNQYGASKGKTYYETRKNRTDKKGSKL